MAHDSYDNNPKKEILTALIGILLLLAMIGGIAMAAWLRPAGEHMTLTAQESVADTADIVNTQSATVAPAQAENAGVDAQAHIPVTTTTTDSPVAAPVETQATTPPPDEATNNDIPANSDSTVISQ